MLPSPGQTWSLSMHEYVSATLDPPFPIALPALPRTMQLTSVGEEVEQYRALPPSSMSAFPVIVQLVNVGEELSRHTIPPAACSQPWKRSECTRADAPVLTPSMRLAPADLKLDELRVVYPGTRRYPLAENVEIVPLVELVNAK